MIRLESESKAQEQWPVMSDEKLMRANDEKDGGADWPSCDTHFPASVIG